MKKRWRYLTWSTAFSRPWVCGQRPVKDATFRLLIRRGLYPKKRSLLNHHYFGYSDQTGHWRSIEPSEYIDGTGYRATIHVVDAGNAELYEQFYRQVGAHIWHLPEWLQKFYTDIGRHLTTE